MDVDDDEMAKGREGMGNVMGYGDVEDGRSDEVSTE